MSHRKDPSSVQIRQVLLEMRRYRMGLIQTADQLRFSYLAVIEGAKYIGRDGDLSLQASLFAMLLKQELSLSSISHVKDLHNIRHLTRTSQRPKVSLTALSLLQGFVERAFQ